MTTNPPSRGLTLVEVLVYAALFGLILSVMSTSIVYTYRLYRDFTTGPRVDRVGIAITDRLVRDIRTGSIVLPESTFGVPTGSLAAAVPTGGGETQKRFFVDDARLMYREGAGDAIPLTPEGMTVSRFLLTRIVTPYSEAVRFDFELTFPTPQGPATRSFDGVSILRRSYD